MFKLPVNIILRNLFRLILNKNPYIVIIVQYCHELYLCADKLTFIQFVLYFQKKLKNLGGKKMGLNGFKMDVSLWFKKPYNDRSILKPIII